MAWKLTTETTQSDSICCLVVQVSLHLRKFNVVWTLSPGYKGKNKESMNARHKSLSPFIKNVQRAKGEYTHNRKITNIYWALTKFEALLVHPLFCVLYSNSLIPFNNPTNMYYHHYLLYMEQLKPREAEEFPRSQSHSYWTTESWFKCKKQSTVLSSIPYLQLKPKH